MSRRGQLPDDELTWEPSERWVRGFRGDTLVVDSRKPRLVWEPGMPVPLYVFPAGDVRTDLLTPAAVPSGSVHAGSTVFYDLTVDDEVLPRAAWSYPGDELGGHIGFEWFGLEGRAPRSLDRWFEEEEEIFVHPRDPYKRVDALHSTRRVRVEADGQVLAETSDPVLLFETRLPTRYYIPRDDVDWDLLHRVNLTTRCPYKGVAQYWSFRGTDAERRSVVWSYPEPLPAVEPIRDRVAFYNEFVDIYVDGILQEHPQTTFSRR
nr:DUF427 domain-containing protein [Streptacidiphilus melanogenes]